MKILRLCLGLALFSVGAGTSNSALAQGSDLFAVEIPGVRNYVALAVGMVPDYLGSDDYQGAIGPAGKVYFGTGTELYARLLATELSVNLWNSPVWAAGPVVNYRFGRDDDVEDSAVGLMRSIDDAVEVGGFISWRTFNPQDRRDQFNTQLQVLADASGTYDGWLATLSARKFVPLGRAFTFSLGGSLTYANGNYMSTYFSVDSIDAARSGLPQFGADSGLRDFRISPMVVFSFSPRWHLAGGVVYSRLLGDAADSPVVDDRGSANQFFTGFGLAYAW